MVLKMFRVLWFLSVLVVLANLLFVYAGLPEKVIIKEDAAETIALSREALFYILMFTIGLINVMVYVLRRMFPEAENLRAWFHGLVITINIFFIISMQAISVYNSNEIFDHSRVPYFISGSLGLILLWATTWPVYLLYQKYFFKPAV